MATGEGLQIMLSTAAPHGRDCLHSSYEAQSKLLNGGLYRAFYRGLLIFGVINGDTRSLDYSSYRLQFPSHHDHGELCRGCSHLVRRLAGKRQRASMRFQQE